MLKKFLQASCFAGKDYGLGIHEVPESVMELPSYKKYVEVGLIVDLESVEVVSGKSVVERQIESSEKQTEAKKVAAESVETKDEEPSEDDADSEQKEEPSRKVKSKNKR